MAPAEGMLQCGGVFQTGGMGRGGVIAGPSTMVGDPLPTPAPAHHLADLALGRSDPPQLSAHLPALLCGVPTPIRNRLGGAWPRISHGLISAG
jgi:hypothetical protein